VARFTEPAFQQRTGPQMFESMASSPEEFSQYIKSEIPRWASNWEQGGDRVIASRQLHVDRRPLLSVCRRIALGERELVELPCGIGTTSSAIQSGQAHRRILGDAERAAKSIALADTRPDLSGMRVRSRPP
jgi:hypothetical protein